MMSFQGITEIEVICQTMGEFLLLLLFRPADLPTCRPADRPADPPTCRPADPPTCRPAGRPTDRPTRRPADLVMLCHDRLLIYFGE